MLKKLLLLTIFPLMFNGCEFIGLATYGKLIDNFSEKSEFEGTPPAMTLKKGEIKPLNFRIKITETDQKNEGSTYIFIDSDNPKIARVTQTAISVTQAINGGKKESIADERVRVVNNNNVPRIEGVSPGETFVGIYFKKNFVNFKVTVTP